MKRRPTDTVSREELRSRIINEIDDPRYSDSPNLRTGLRVALQVLDQTPAVEGEVLASVSDDAVPRIATARRQLLALIRDLQDQQGIEPRALAIALGSAAACFTDYGLNRILLGIAWQRLGDEFEEDEGAPE